MSTYHGLSACIVDRPDQSSNEEKLVEADLFVVVLTRFIYQPSATDRSIPKRCQQPSKWKICAHSSNGYHSIEYIKVNSSIELWSRYIDR